jgi:hypothetical protein
MLLQFGCKFLRVGDDRISRTTMQKKKNRLRIVFRLYLNVLLNATDPDCDSRINCMLAKR